MNPTVAEKNLRCLFRFQNQTAKGLFEHLRIQRERGIKPKYVLQQNPAGQPTLLKVDSSPVKDLTDRGFRSNLKNTLQTLNSIDESTLLVWSCGLGHWISGLNHVKHPTKLIIVEPENDILFASMQAVDWTGILSSWPVLFLREKDAVDKAFELIETHGSLFEKGYHLLAGRRLLDHEFDQYNLVEAKIETSRSSFFQFQQSELDIEANKVVIASGDAHREILDVLTDEAQTLGYKAEGIYRSGPISRFVDTKAAWQEALGNPLPAIILSFTQKVFTSGQWYLMKEAGIKRMVWCYDDPFRYKWGDAFFDNCDLIFCFDPFLTERLQQISPTLVQYMPAATTYSHGIEPTEQNLPETPISFVGSTGLQRLDEQFIKMVAENAAPLKRLEEFVVSYISKGHHVPYDDLMGMDLAFKGMSENERVCLLEDLCTFYLRINCLSALKGMPFRIFGDEGWANELLVGQIRKAYAGKAPDFRRETPMIYSRSKINLNVFNVQCVNSPTVRMFDVMACGGFLLTEYRPFLEDMFEPGVDLETFHTPAQLREKIEYYLNHDDEREKIAQRGCKKVLTKHRYRDRLAEMLKNEAPL